MDNIAPIVGSMTETEYTDAWRESVAAALRMALAESGVSRRALSRESGISDNTLHRYFNAQRDLPLDVLLEVATFLDTTPDAIIAMAQAVFERRVGKSWGEYVLAAKRGDIEPDEQ